eukprot:349879_1
MSVSRYHFDYNWLFHLGEDGIYTTCDVDDFPINMNGIQCTDLKRISNINNISDCINACCGNTQCEMYQYYTSNNTCYNGQYNQTNCKNSTQNNPLSGMRPIPARCTKYNVINPSYNDQNWRKLDIPHDYAIEQRFDNRNALHNGYLPTNISFYRKHFKLNHTFINKTIWIDFDGIYRNSDVWLNGIYLGYHESGYTSHRY